MSQADQMMTESNILYAMSINLAFSMLHRNKLASWAEWLSNDSEFQTEGASSLKAFADNAQHSYQMIKKVQKQLSYYVHLHDPDSMKIW